jgi:hypothetical protein
MQTVKSTLVHDVLFVAKFPLMKLWNRINRYVMFSKYSNYDNV